MDRQSHNESIIAQFNLQAIPYTEVPAHKDGLGIMIAMAEINENDTVLDVACGTGIVSCEFAKYAKLVTGIDITEGMLAQAKKLEEKNKLRNTEWVLGDVNQMPFEDNRFSVVVSRFSFHHFVDTEQVLEEMIRVCKPQGKIMLVDVAIPKEKQAAYDRMEKLRDPSHTGALSPKEFEELFKTKQLNNCRQSSYTMEIDLEAQLKASFPKQGDKEKLQMMIQEDVGKDHLGVNVKKEGGRYILSYPIHIYIGTK